MGQRPGSKMAPGSGSSAMWPSKLALRIKVRTAECQGPQSCLPVRRGTSFVEGREEEGEYVIWCCNGCCNGSIFMRVVRGQGKCIEGEGIVLFGICNEGEA